MQEIAAKDLQYNVSPELMEKVVIGGDLSKLTASERLNYYGRVCESLGINPMTKPFAYLQLSGRLVLYASRDCTDQLRASRKISVAIVSRERLDDTYIVTSRATTPDGRSDESIGAVSLSGLKGDPLANAYMKAETKAKRRVTLSICGLGWLDESEIETVTGAVPVEAEADPEPSAADTAVIDNTQRRKLFGVLKSAGVEHEGFKRWLEFYLQISSTSLILQRNFDSVLDAIRRGEVSEWLVNEAGGVIEEHEK